MLPKFYFINLDRSEDRLQHMNKFFRKIKKKTEFEPRYLRISAFDGKKENVNNFSNLKMEDMWLNKEQMRKAIPPEFGCCYSHIKAMKTYLDDEENKDDFAFICEDDLEMFKIEKHFFKDVVKQVIEKVKLNDLVSISCVGSPIVIKPLEDNIKSPVFLDYHNNRGKLYGTGCYLITRNLAEKIVKNHWDNGKLIIEKEHNSMVADHFIYPRGEKTCFLIPSLFTLRQSNDSYIHSQHLEMHDKVQISMFNMWNKFNVAKTSQIAIISNNEWGNQYYVQKTIKYNSPTVGTKMSPIDYIKFLEKFDEYIKITPELLKIEKYPIGKIKLDEDEIKIHFFKETSWEDSLKHWEERKKLLPKKSDILFKICDRKFEGELSRDLLLRFYKCNISKKAVFLSELNNYKNEFTDKKYSVKIIPKNLSDNENMCCPEGNELYSICGIN